MNIYQLLNVRCDYFQLNCNCDAVDSIYLLKKLIIYINLRSRIAPPI